MVLRYEATASTDGVPNVLEELTLKMLYFDYSIVITITSVCLWSAWKATSAGALRRVYSIYLSDIDSIDCGWKNSSAKFDGASPRRRLFSANTSPAPRQVASREKHWLVFNVQPSASMQFALEALFKMCPEGRSFSLCTLQEENISTHGWTRFLGKPQIQ